jgi:hypothetical protein
MMEKFGNLLKLRVVALLPKMLTLLIEVGFMVRLLKWFGYAVEMCPPAEWKHCFVLEQKLYKN